MRNNETETTTIKATLISPEMASSTRYVNLKLMPRGGSWSAQESPPAWPQEGYRQRRNNTRSSVVEGGILSFIGVWGYPLSWHQGIPSPRRTWDRTLDRISDKTMGYPIGKDLGPEASERTWDQRPQYPLLTDTCKSITAHRTSYTGGRNEHQQESPPV